MKNTSYDPKQVGTQLSTYLQYVSACNKTTYVCDAVLILDKFSARWNHLFNFSIGDCA